MAASRKPGADAAEATSGAVLDLAARLKRDNEPFALATVVRSEGATSAKAGAKAIVRADGEIEGWVGGGCSQPAVRGAARKALRDGKSRLIRIRPTDDDDGGEGVETLTMACHSGGSLEIFVEPVLPRPALFVLGASAAGQALAALAGRVGFAVTAAAPKGDVAAFGEVERVVEGFDLGGVATSASDFVVVATQGKGDRQALEAALATGAGYIAFISSRRKASALKEELKARGHDFARLDAIHAPAGLDIGAVTPAEVALAILADVVRERRRGLAATAARDGAGQAAGVTTEVVAPLAAGCCGTEPERD